MAILFESGDRPVDSILHPTDLSEESQTAYEHALALAIGYGAELTLLHAVGRRATDSWPHFPSVRDTLSKWRAAGMSERVQASARKASVSKMQVKTGDPVAASLEHIQRGPVDLIVMATEGRSGLSRLLRAPRAEKLARLTKLPTLFIPAEARPFVISTTGEVALQSILVPVSPLTDPRPAMLFAVRCAAMLQNPSLEITLLHVGADHEDAMEAPALPFCTWNVVRRSGDVVEQILAEAEKAQTSMISMATAWQRPVLGMVDGGVTERVLRGAGCPVAAVPVESG